MNIRGRPKKNGFQPPWMLERVTLVLYAYERARAAGLKHESAMEEAVNFVRAKRSQMKISIGAVKRILAEWRSKNRISSILVQKPEPSHRTIILPNGRIARVLLTVYKAPRIDYPRTNAASRSDSVISQGSSLIGWQFPALGAFSASYLIF